MSACDAELCLHWDGHGCPCDDFDIERPGPGADPFSVRAATYTRTEIRRDDSVCGEMVNDPDEGDLGPCGRDPQHAGDCVAVVL